LRPYVAAGQTHRINQVPVELLSFLFKLPVELETSAIRD
jgi:hypothetical protein